jgi:hypothetical protein
MSMVKHAHLISRQVKRMREALEYLKPIIRPVTMPAQGRQREGVSSVISEVETAL